MPHVHTPSIDSMMREVRHRLGKIDVEHEIRLDRVARSTADHELKIHIRREIEAAHHERREPYLELLTTLQQRQHRLSFQDCGPIRQPIDGSDNGTSPA